jgi:cell division protein FtsB
LGLDKKEFIKIFCLILLFLGLIVAWLAFGDRGFIHLYQMEKERKVYAERIRALEEENQRLLEQIERLRGDKAYIESEAREELGLLKENEVIYRFEGEKERKEAGAMNRAPTDTDH